MGLEDLKGKRNLLGFSAGVDSSALFFLLMAHEIDFDIAIVDYKIRKQSKKEVAYAKHLAKKYNKRIVIHKAQHITTNFESNARAVRFDFFKNTINDLHYNNLILANQLNDRLEWFLMQLCKGCGLNSLLGFTLKTQCKGFDIIRPLFCVDREEILAFLKKNHIQYFIDESNENQKFLRNYFRANFANSLIKKHKNGITKSLHLLFDDYLALYSPNAIYKVLVEDFFIGVFKITNDKKNLHYIDLCAKELGYVVSSSQREEILKARYSCIIADKIIVDCNTTHIFVTKNIKSNIALTKDFREMLRKNKIPPRIRKFINTDILKRLKEACK